MKALSCQAVSMFFPLRRATATLAVPTSRPMGWVALSRSSRRCSASSAPFKRLSLRSSMLLPSAFVGCWHLLGPAGRALLLVPGLIRRPAVVEPLSLGADLVQAASLPIRLFAQDPLRVAHASPRLAQHFQEFLVVAVAEHGHAGREAIVLVGQPE